MLSLEQAQRAINAAKQKAESLSILVSIAAVDRWGILVAFVRMDGALTISSRFAFAKAYTAGTLGIPTEKLAKYAEPRQPYYGLNSLFGGELTTIPGGIPMLQNGNLIGGIGVGGSTDVSQDVLCAQAGVESLSS